ncbi:MAG TPA: carboxypeptidase regulatory-like domain-containing protein [Puia sp.]|nr:carboxypeptidase regulatory-like domain-containing protein [Puia sp.]
MIKYLLLSALSFFLVLSAMAQVTTGSITGLVTDSKGQPLGGATVKAVDVPSGTSYTTTATSKGEYTLPNLRVSDDYTLTIGYVGHTPATFDHLNVRVGDPVNVNAILEITGQTLNEATVTGASKTSVISSQRTGPSTYVNEQMIQMLPTLNHSIQDYIRFTPAAVSITASDGTPDGISFAGSNNRYNALTIDGASATDVFGLAATGTNGGQAGVNTIPLEAIAGMQVLTSPYDVTQGGFTGGGINAVTKSGTNTLHGTVYATMQNQNLVGKGPTTDLPYGSFKNNYIGANIGGAFIRNKLFYFVNVEHYSSTTPLPYDPSQANSGSKFTVGYLDTIYNYVKSTYYDPGSFTGINKTAFYTNVFARIDYNISSRTKLTIRNAYVHGSNYIISRSPTAITFANSGYAMVNTTNSSVIELNSNFARSANVLRVTYNNIADHRTTSSFPNLTIYDGSVNDVYLGGDYSSQANSLQQNNFTLTDNYTLYRGNHTITFGTNDELYNSSNVFVQNYYGSYTYSSFAAFQANNAAPYNYYINYNPSDPGSKNPAKLHAAMFSVYGGDVVTLASNFKLTYGLRIDMPAFFSKPRDNEAFNTDANFAGYSNQTVPKAMPLLGPRVGFNWDVHHNGKTQLRGGAGIFTGRVPYVWISNQIGSDGVSLIKYSGYPASLRFNYNPQQNLNGAYIPTGTAPATEVDLTDKHFKVPQDLRANLGIDQRLPWWGLIGTIEAVYTKKINDINYQNLNVGTQAGTVTIGDATYPWYNFGRKDSKFTDIMLLTNTSKGYAYNFTAKLEKPYTRSGWMGSIAYSLGHSFSLNDGSSSVALSNWRYAVNSRGLNNLDEGHSDYDMGSRIIGYVAKQFKYAHNHLGTTIGIVYEGRSGQPYSVTYNRNMTGDDATAHTSNNYNSNELYIPTAAELNDPNGYQNYTFVDLKSGTTVTRTAAQEWQDFKTFIGNDPGMKKHEGQIMPKNADRTPWENHFDAKVSEDFMLGVHKLQIEFDILNVGNLFDHKSGWSYYVPNQNASPLATSSQSTTPTFTFDQTKENLINGAYKAYSYTDLLSRWRGQLSVRYSF